MSTTKPPNQMIDGLGTAATKNTGTASGDIPLLGASGLPAVSGELLTGVIPANDSVVTAKILDANVTAAKFDSGKYGGKYLHIRDEKAANTAGGTFTQDAWQERVLNTEVTDEIGSTLADNEFSLPVGTYYVRASAQGNQCGLHRVRLYNVTDTAVALLGQAVSSTTTVTAGVNAHVCGRLTVSGGAKTFRLEHRCETTRNTDGFGRAANWDSMLEVYATVEVWKVD